MYLQKTKQHASFYEGRRILFHTIASLLVIQINARAPIAISYQDTNGQFHCSNTECVLRGRGAVARLGQFDVLLLTLSSCLFVHELWDLQQFASWLLDNFVAYWFCRRGAYCDYVQTNFHIVLQHIHTICWRHENSMMRTVAYPPWNYIIIVGMTI